MKIVDISQEVMSCEVYPGDPKPQSERLADMARGDLYHLTAFSMCAHNGTHIDAPFHFIRDGKTVESLALDIFVGACFVARHKGDVTARDAHFIMEQARTAGASKRILIAGDATVTSDAARVFASSGICLLGNEGQTVGPEDAPMEVHRILLGQGVALLEGIRLDDVSAGKYFLNAAPLNLGGFDGAPCRAYLISE